MRTVSAFGCDQQLVVALVPRTVAVSFGFLTSFTVLYLRFHCWFFVTRLPRIFPGSPAFELQLPFRVILRGRDASFQPTLLTRPRSVPDSFHQTHGCSPNCSRGPKARVSTEKCV